MAAVLNDDLIKSVLKKSFIKGEAELLEKKSVEQISNNITTLQNAFNKIYTSTLNVKNIQKQDERRLKNIKKEVTIESKMVTMPGASAGAEFEIGNLPDVFKRLTESIEGLTNNLDQLDMSQTGDGDSIDIDIDDNSKKRRRGAGRRGSRGRGRLGRGLGRGVGRVGATLLLAIGADMALGAFGVGDVDEDALDAQDQKNWSRMSLLNKAESIIPRGIEFAGGVLGLTNISAQAKASRIRDETKYLDRKAAKSFGGFGGGISGGGGASGSFESVRTSQLGSASFSSRFSDFIRDNISNMSAWAMASGGAISALAGAYNLAKSIFDGGGGGGGATGPWDGAAVEFDGDVNKILATIRTVESGGDYSTPKPKGMAGTASGAYSFIDKTWKSLTKKYRIGTQYSKAYLAPPAIQDAVAGMYVQEILKNVNNDVSRVPVVWYTGNYKGQLSVEAQGINKGLAVSTYQQKWLSAYAGLGGKINTNASTWKGSGKITSGFGMRRHPVLGTLRMHEGVDIHGEIGDPVGAAYPGTIIRAGQLSGYGLVVDIDHGKGAVTRYAHLSAIRVHKGKQVTSGDQIGDVGRSGLGTGAHLHYELIYNGEPVNSRESFLQRKEFITGTRSTKGKQITAVSPPAQGTNILFKDPMDIFNQSSQPSPFAPGAASPAKGNPSNNLFMNMQIVF